VGAEDFQQLGGAGLCGGVAWWFRSWGSGLELGYPVDADCYQDGNAGEWE